MALHWYHDQHQCFPPAYIADKTGKPMHSWRVLILPYLEGGLPLYQRYRFDEPWNGPNNRLLADEIAEFYSCTEIPQAKRGETSYLAIVGPATPWPGEKSATLRDLTDGPSNVILLVEAHGSGIQCLEPRDLDLATFVPEVNPPRGTGPSSPHPWKKDMRQTLNGAHVLMASGEMRFLGRTTESRVVASQLRGNDGTIMPADETP